jgi:hypothetical protein
MPRAARSTRTLGGVDSAIAFMTLIARETLRKSQYFLDKARSLSIAERNDLSTLLEAAIVFSRSVTLHLQKELASEATFGPWYEEWRRRLGQSPISVYLLEQRNYVLKEGPLRTRRILSIAGTARIRITASATIRVIRSAPWYRRAPSIIVQDLLWPLREWLRKRRQRRELEHRDMLAREAVAASSQPATDLLYFAEHEWADTPAMNLVGQHLSLLDDLVTDAERTFRNFQGNAA